MATGIARVCPSSANKRSERVINSPTTSGMWGRAQAENGFWGILVNSRIDPWCDNKFYFGTLL